MAILKCKMCGGDLDINGDNNIAVCQYCGSKQTLPQAEDKKLLNLYNFINQLRINNKYDEALELCSKVLAEEKTNPETYWNRVLCDFGIVYVEDPVNHKRMPTINRMQYKSVLKNSDYLNALKYADQSQREIFEQQAAQIDQIQKQFFDISKKEKPYDVFICYKETDDDGNRTQDSVIANELYHQLTKEGFKVFFSRITLENKLGSEYEPYIFAALNSAKVMVVIGSKPEHFNAVWVRNEWGRFLNLAKNDSSKMLIPAYKNMDAFELPVEFSDLHAQDISKIGFMPDLTRGIKKIISDANRKSGVSGFLKRNVKWLIPGIATICIALITIVLFMKTSINRQDDEVSNSDNHITAVEKELKALGLENCTINNFAEENKVFLALNEEYDFTYAGFGSIVVDTVKIVDSNVANVLENTDVKSNTVVKATGLGKTKVYLVSDKMVDTVELVVYTIELPKFPVFNENNDVKIEITDAYIKDSNLYVAVKYKVNDLVLDFYALDFYGFWLVSPKGDYVKFFSINTEYIKEDVKDGYYCKVLHFKDDLNELVLMPGKYVLEYGECVNPRMITHEADYNDSPNIDEKSNSDTNFEIINNNQKEEKSKYSSFIGTWSNEQTLNEITIKNVTDNEITFTWFLYRLGGIDNNTTIPFKDGKGIFYYQFYDDKNYDGKQTEDEKHIRKATIELTNNGVNVIVKDVNQIDENYVLLDDYDFNGAIYCEPGIYAHTNKQS